MAASLLTRPSFSLSQAAVRVFNAGVGLHSMQHSAETIELALQDLRPLQGSALLIGGMAVIEYGYLRYTEDLDLLYKNRDGSILERLSSSFEIVIKAESGWHQLQHRKTGVRLELIPEGALGQYGFLPFCDAVAGAAGYVSLAGLIHLKLIARRLKDQADIVELYKRNAAQVEGTCASLPVELQPALDSLIAEAKSEMRSDPYRNVQNRPYGQSASGAAAAPGEGIG